MWHSRRTHGTLISNYDYTLLWNSALHECLHSMSFTIKHSRVPWKRCIPTITAECLIIAPSGHRLPCSTAKPPSALSGASKEAITSLRRTTDCTTFCATVNPETVVASPWSRGMSSCRIAETPPALSKSAKVNGPAGFSRQMYGVCLLIKSKSSSERLISTSRAIAIKCRIALVDPPNAIRTLMAFSNAPRVKNGPCVNTLHCEVHNSLACRMSKSQ